MNLEYLQSFYMTVKNNSISKAAKALHLTQPAVSMQLRNLENEFGTALLIRSNKGVELTEEGKIVFDYADTLLSIQGNIERDIKSLQENIPKLLIGSCKTVGEHALPCSIYTFKHKHKEVDISMTLHNSCDVIEMLKDHTINLGIIQHDPEDETLILQQIISDELVLVGAGNDVPHTVTLDELIEMPLILREQDSGTFKTLCSSLENHALNCDCLNIIYHLNSPGAIKSSLLAGKGFSFLPRLIVSGELKDGSLKEIHVENFQIPAGYFMAQRSKCTLSKHEDMFKDFILSSKRGFC